MAPDPIRLAAGAADVDRIYMEQKLALIGFWETAPAFAPGLFPALMADAPILDSLERQLAGGGRS